MAIRSITRLTFRCSTSEAKQARRRAERESVTLSVALRCLLADYAAGRMPSVLVARSNEELRDALRPIGVNLNQAARSLNAGELPSELESILRELATKVRQLVWQLDALKRRRRP